MDLNLFYKNIKIVIDAIYEISITLSDEEPNITLDTPYQSLCYINSFFADKSNLIFLNDSACKNNDQHLQPLDLLCKVVYSKLVDIEPYLSAAPEDIKNKSYLPVNGSFRANFPPVEQLFYNHFSQLFLYTEALWKSKVLDALSILKYLRGHNKTLIIVGPNGSGKTSLANYLKDIESHISVIPAAKPIRAMEEAAILHSTIDKYNQELYSSSKHNQELLQHLITGLCTDHDDKIRIAHDRGQKIETNYLKIKRIFESFFDLELDHSEFGMKKILARKGINSPFPFNSMSDGERAAFFYIATVIVAPATSFILVDEPESHLNPAIYNKIWDRLIAERSDCQFIFISHTIDFICARSDFELLQIKEFSPPNSFTLDFLGDSLDNLSTNLIVEILGSRKPIMFCEGTKDKYDYKIYNCLFGKQYTVIPTGDCTVVMNSVRSCNKHARTYGIQAAVGIIDSDLKSNTKISELEKDNIYVLECNEIEMLLLDEIIFVSVLDSENKPLSIFEEFQTAFFSQLRTKKNTIVKRLVKTQLDEYIQNSNIDDKRNITKEDFQQHIIQIFTDINNQPFWDKADKKIEQIIEKSDYTFALRYCCLGHKEIVGGITNKFISNYAFAALYLLQNDPKIAATIRDKYFPKLNLL